MRYIHKVCAWSQYENPIWVYINGNVSNPLVIPATLYLMISNGTQNRSLKVIPDSRPRFQTRVLRQYLDIIFHTIRDMYIWSQHSNCWFIPLIDSTVDSYPNFQREFQKITLWTYVKSWYQFKGPTLKPLLVICPWPVLLSRQREQKSDLFRTSFTC